MLSGGASLDADRIERAVTDYLDTTSWVIALTMLKAPRWMPYPGRGKATRAAGYLRSECLRIVSERRASGQERNDLLSLLLEAADPETGQRMSDRELADNVLTFMTAGHETTALALTWTFYLLSLHPEVEERVRAEVDAVVGAGEIASEHVKALPYTSQVIQESMRLYPPAPLVVREPIQPTSIGPLRLNPGTAVYIPIYAVHRHHRLWEAPATFDPDRFEPAQIRARHRYSYLPFGAGPRVCIGMSFALTEAVVILATILQGAQLRLRPNYVPVPKLRVTLRPALGMPMRVVRCEHESR
jgi:cytochrome P450